MGRPELSRRRFVRGLTLGAGAVVAAPLLGACGSDGGSTATGPTTPASTGGSGVRKLATTSKEVIWTDFGGATREVRKRVYFEPFEKEYGISVRVAEPDLAKFLQGAKDGTPTYDMFDLPPGQVINLVDKTPGDLQKLPADVTRTDVVLLPYRDFVGGGFSYSYVMTWLDGTFSGPSPRAGRTSSIFRSSRASGPSAGTWPQRSRCWPTGWLPTSSCPMTSTGPTPSGLRSRASCSSTSATPRARSSWPRERPACSSSRTAERWTCARRSPGPGSPTTRRSSCRGRGCRCPGVRPHPDAMFALLDFMDQPERQADFAREIAYGPTNPKALDLLDESEKKDLANTPDKLKIGVVIDARGAALQTEEARTAYMTFASG